MRYFTNDRIISLLCFGALSSTLFLSPVQWLTTSVILATWGIMGFLTIVFGSGIFVLMGGDAKSLAYAATVVYKRRTKKGGVIGDLLDQVPTGGIAAVLIWHNYFAAAAMAFALWVLSNYVVGTSIKYFNCLNDSDQEKLLKAVRES